MNTRYNQPLPDNYDSQQRLFSYDSWGSMTDFLDRLATGNVTFDEQIADGLQPTYQDTVDEQGRPAKEAVLHILQRRRLTVRTSGEGRDRLVAVGIEKTDLPEGVSDPGYKILIGPDGPVAHSTIEHGTAADLMPLSVDGPDQSAAQDRATALILALELQVA